MARVYGLTTLFLISMIFVFEMSTDIYIASLPQMAQLFGVDDSTSQWTLSAYLFGFSLLGCLAGPLSDSIGRRKVMLAGAACFCLATIICWFAPTMNALILARFIQGLGAGVGIVMVPAIIKDLYSEKDCSKILSAMGMIVAMAPMIAPLVGAAIAHVSNWRYCFLTLAIMSGGMTTLGLLRLKESLPPSQRAAFSIPRLMNSYRLLITQRETIGHVLISAVAYGGLWAWITEAPFFMIDHLGLSIFTYGLYATLGPAAYILGSYMNTHLVEHFGVNRMLEIGVWIMTAGTFFIFFTASIYPSSIFFLYITLMFYSIGLAPVWANATTRAVDVLPHHRGVASAILTTVEMALGALFAYLVSFIEGTSMVPVASMMVLSSAIAILLLFWIKQGSHKDLSTNMRM